MHFSHPILAVGLLLSLLFTVTVRAAQTPHELELIHVLPLNAEPAIGELQPSGLANCDGKLLMVSDRHNQRIFELQRQDRHVQVSESHILDNIPKPELANYDFGDRWWTSLVRRYDWEGVSCQGGNTYLLSETLSQVLRITADGQLSWLGDKAYRSGKQKGLFEQTNAKGEGLAVGQDFLFIAAERQPRGIVRQSRNDRDKLTAFYLNDFPDLLRPQDFSGLWLEHDALYTLERNHFQVCKRSLAEMPTNRCWSYGHVENDPQWDYQDQRFGMAEGIARIDEQLFIVLDNNGDVRLRNPKDKRPILMVFKLPKDW